MNQAFLITYMTIFSIFGTLTNMMCLIVFYKFYTNYSSILIFFSLSLVGFLSSVILVPLELVQDLEFYKNDILCSLNQFLRYFMNIFSIFLVCLLALERYRNVSKSIGQNKIFFLNKIPMFPFKYSSKLCLLMSILFAAFIAIFSIYSVRIDPNNQSSCTRKETLFYNIFLTVGFFIILFIICLIFTRIYLIARKCQVKISISTISKIACKIQTNMSSSEAYRGSSLTENNLLTNCKGIRNDLSIAKIFILVKLALKTLD